MELNKELRIELVLELAKLITELDNAKDVFIRTKNNPEHHDSALSCESEIYFLEQEINTIKTALIENKISYI
jgi:hypothetical protein